MTDLPERLESLAASLEGFEWELHIRAREDCLAAAEEIERLREELDLWRRLAKTAGNAFADLLAVCGEGNAIGRPCDIIHRADWRRMQNWQKEIEAVENAREG